MREINADPELTTLYQEIVRVIHRGRIRDDVRATINESSSECKHKTIKEIITDSVLKSFSTNPVKWPGKLAMSSAAEYFTQQKENDSGENLRLKHDELVRFSSAMNEQDISKRNRMMKYLEGDFAMYAQYWFHRDKTAHEAGNDDEAEKYFARFGEVWRPVLRKDSYRAEAMKYKIEGLMRYGVSVGNAGEILKCLDEMRANTELDEWANNIFAGMVYFALGMKNEAEECVMCNVDFGYECEISGKVLAEMGINVLPDSIEQPQKKLNNPQPKLQETTSSIPPISDEDFIELCISGNTVKVSEAMSNGANVNAIDYYGRTALMLTAFNGHTETAEILITHGADETNHASML